MKDFEVEPVRVWPTKDVPNAAQPITVSKESAAVPVAGRVHAGLARSSASVDWRDPLGGSPVPPAVAGILTRRRAVRGASLPVALTESAGRLLGADLSGVRVHSDNEAGQIARRLQAEAFTYGSDVYFAPGRFEPSSRSGQHLLAHELAHAAQAGTSSASPSTIGRIDDPAEAAADRAADQLVPTLRRQAAAMSLQPGTPTSRQPAGRTVYRSASTIRRRVGFEIQTNFPMKKADGDNYSYRDRTFSDKTTDPADDRDPYFHIEADLRGATWERERGLPSDPENPTSIMEFVTGAFDTTTAGQQNRADALQRIDLFMQTVRALLPPGGEPVKLTEVADAYNGKLGSKNTSSVKVLDDDAVLGEAAPLKKAQHKDPLVELASAQPQTTFALPLPRLTEGLQAILRAMITTLDSATCSFTPQQITSEKAQAQARLDNLVNAKAMVEDNLKHFETTSPERQARLKTLPQPSVESLKGLLVLIQVFITEPRKLTGKVPPYAKAYFTFMHRVDFNSLYRSLPEDAQPLVKEFLNDYAAHFEKFEAIKQLLPLGLGDESKAGPTTADWLRSIHQAGAESELTDRDRSRIHRRAFAAVEATPLADKSQAALALFRGTPLGEATEAASELEATLSSFAAKSKDFYDDISLAKTLDFGKHLKFAAAFNEAWTKRGEVPYERFLLAGVCAKQIKAGTLTAEEYDVLSHYVAGTGTIKPDEALLKVLEARFTTEYLKRDLLSRGKITEGEESASMGRWGLDKAQQEGAILELRAMPTGVTPADWERFAKAAHEAIVKSGG